jgi:hypothetical protein
MVTETVTESASSTARARPVSRMLKGEAAIVTGSTSGIGLGIANALAAEGAHVMLNG